MKKKYAERAGAKASQETTMADGDHGSWWGRTFGRSILSLLIGHFFADKNNTASIIAIMLVFTLCYAVIFREKYDLIPGLLNIVFVVIGYYFAAKRHRDTDDEGDQDEGK